MASYSDYIKMLDYLPVYDIASESSNNLWASFIPTNQFCDLLQRTLTAVASADKSKRKSIWVQGTFGTGKSHASSVIRHLLCDPFSDIELYTHKIEDDSLRNQLVNYRKTKRFFSVVIKGVEGAYDLRRFSLSLQREVKDTLIKAGYSNIIVKSDFESAITYVREHERYTQDAIDSHDELHDIAPTPDKVIARLESNDIQAYMELEEALYKTVGVTLTSKSVSEWLAEIEQAIEAEGIADGLIIFWDEFTSIMEAIGSDRINVLQNIAEKAQSCNLFLFLISHRVEDQVSSGSKKDDVRTMNDRFDTIRYIMDEVSTYRVMRHTFEIDRSKAGYDILVYNRTVRLNELIDRLCDGRVAEERTSILNLFPMHPYSAFLCSKLSDYVGSANRSVVNFMNDEKKGFRKFISDETVFEQHGLLTAEWLWDFFFDSFASNPQCAAFIANYNSYIHRVQEAGDDYVRVYKGILLLNTLSTQFATHNSEIIARISPNEDSIRGLFADDRIEPKIDEILRFLDTNQIIARDVFGEFKISVSSLNPQEIAKEKEKVAAEFKSAVNYLDYNFAAKSGLTKLFTVGDYLIRKCEPQIYSCTDSESVIRSRLNRYTNEKPNYLHVAIYIAVTEEERRSFEIKVKDFSDEFPNSIHIIPDEVFTTEARTKFIDLIANHKVAKSHYQESIEKESELAAKQLINKWSNRLVSGTFTLYFNGEQTREGIINNVYSLINKKFSYRIFSKGMESIKAYRSIQSSFLANKNFPALVLQVLQAPNRDKLTKFTGSDLPAKYIFEDNNNHLIDEECRLTPAAVSSDAWIVQVCREVDECVENAKKKYVDKFSLSEIFAPLMRPPFGFFPSRANWVAFSYALRKHKADLFTTSVSQPISDEKLADMIKDLFVMWNEGHSEANNKLLLRFGSKEESDLTRLLFEVFQLQLVKDVPEAKSLANVRWGINEFCKQKTKYPLWVLTYCDNVNDKRSEIIKRLIEVLDADQNPDITKIKELYRLVNSEKIDIAQLASNPQNYENGFLNFVKSLKNVKIQSEWWNELLEEISHLQSEIAYRKETDVRECVLNFYIMKQNQKNPVPVHAQPSAASSSSQAANAATNIPDEVQTLPAQPKSPNPDIVKKAKSLVKEANMPSILWQKVVLDIIEDNPEIAEYISNYLS